MPTVWQDASVCAIHLERKLVETMSLKGNRSSVWDAKNKAQKNQRLFRGIDLENTDSLTCTAKINNANEIIISGKRLPDIWLKRHFKYELIGCPPPPHITGS
ncbi:uncharacterized protein LOC121593018 [Anopheles merus]|uniref:uncharacterized protein LOC121593018 n=1 Tax=Anopheles merus TaxID=30066 RepID=UPI001BE47259|nr:uncharacterized protein LOC121593018 [Anopheles merus]